MKRRSYCNILPGYAGPSRHTQATVSDIIATALVPPRATLRGSTAINQLADDMRSGAHREGGVSRDDLKLLGWTGTQLDEHGDFARTRAQLMSAMS